MNEDREMYEPKNPANAVAQQPTFAATLLHGLLAQSQAAGGSLAPLMSTRK